MGRDGGRDDSTLYGVVGNCIIGQIFAPFPSSPAAASSAMIVVAAVGAYCTSVISVVSVFLALVAVSPGSVPLYYELPPWIQWRACTARATTGVYFPPPPPPPPSLRLPALAPPCVICCSQSINHHSSLLISGSLLSLRFGALSTGP